MSEDWQERASRLYFAQFRLRFEKENNGDGAHIWAMFNSGNAASNKRALTITYTHL